MSDAEDFVAIFRKAASYMAADKAVRPRYQHGS
jgi:hypothetical protein